MWWAEPGDVAGEGDRCHEREPGSLVFGANPCQGGRFESWARETYLKLVAGVY